MPDELTVKAAREGGYIAGYRAGMRHAAELLREVRRRATAKADTMDVAGLDVIAWDFEHREEPPHDER